MGDERSTLPIAVSIRFLKTLVQSLTSVFGRPFFRARNLDGSAWFASRRSSLRERKRAGAMREHGDRLESTSHWGIGTERMGP
jgi:hypothetical protein